MKQSFQNEPARTVGIALLCLSIAALVLTIHTSASHDETAANQFHCDMVQMWEQDAAQGIEENRRRGWPNYNNRECK